MVEDEKKSRRDFRTISLPKQLVDEVERIIELLKYWPTKTDFVREAVLDKIEKYKEQLNTRKI